MSEPKNAFTLDGKVVVVTGGTSGIGRAAALALADAGASVVIGGRRTAEGEAVAGEIRSAGGEALFRKTDVTETAQTQALIQSAVDAFGGVDIAFNNAGTEGRGLVPLVEESEDNLRHVMEVNFFAVWNAMKAEIPVMSQRGGGSIINTSSVAGHRGFGTFSSYVASKFAVEGLTRSVAQEVTGLGIRVNSVAPGPIATALLDRATGGDPSGFTQMVPMQRLGTPEEVAHLVTFLASDASSYVTGQALKVDGGMTS